MEPLLMIMLAVTVYGGYLFPIVGLVMSWGQWFRIKTVPPSVPWRRSVSIAGLTLLTVCFPLWFYAVVRELRNDYAYIFRSAQVGRWSSLLVFAISLFAEGKLRRYLLIGAIGLFFFFAMSIGELP